MGYNTSHFAASLFTLYKYRNPIGSFIIRYFKEHNKGIELFSIRNVKELLKVSYPFAVDDSVNPCHNLNIWNNLI
jgi:hypothetical protein